MNKFFTLLSIFAACQFFSFNAQAWDQENHLFCTISGPFVGTHTHLIEHGLMEDRADLALNWNSDNGGLFLGGEIELRIFLAPKHARDNFQELPPEIVVIPGFSNYTEFEIAAVGQTGRLELKLVKIPGENGYSGFALFDFVRLNLACSGASAGEQ